RSQVPDGKAGCRRGREPLARLAVRCRLSQVHPSRVGARLCSMDEQGGLAETRFDSLTGTTNQAMRIAQHRAGDEVEGLCLVVDKRLGVEQLGARPYEQLDRDAADRELGIA